MEVDLLRGGEHTTAVPRHRPAQRAGEFEYHVSIHRFDNLEDHFVYPIRLNELLPQIAVPLDLQAVFLRTYDAGPYRRKIDYRQDVPVPPLTPAWQEWLGKVVTES